MSYRARFLDGDGWLTCRAGRVTHLHTRTLLVDLPDGRTVEIEWTGPDEPEPVTLYKFGPSRPIIEAGSGPGG